MKWITEPTRLTNKLARAKKHFLSWAEICDGGKKRRDEDCGFMHCGGYAFSSFSPAFVNLHVVLNKPVLSDQIMGVKACRK